MNTLLSADGTPLAYERVGEGAALILVGGALDSGTRSFLALLELARVLAPHFTVVTYDRRGRGDSGDGEPYDAMREVEDIEALIGEAGGSAFLYGFSSGAALALRAAAALGPGRIKGLALYEPPYGSSPEEARAFARYDETTNALLASGKNGEAVALFLADMMIPEALVALRQTPEWAKLETLAPTLTYDNAILGEGGLVPTELAMSVSVPTLVLYGSATFAFMQDAANALTRALPAATQQVLYGQDHAVAPEKLGPVLTGFLKEETA